METTLTAKWLHTPFRSNRVFNYRKQTEVPNIQVNTKRFLLKLILNVSQYVILFCIINTNYIYLFIHAFVYLLKFFYICHYCLLRLAALVRLKSEPSLHNYILQLRNWEINKGIPGCKEHFRMTTLASQILSTDSWKIKYLGKADSYKNFEGESKTSKTWNSIVKIPGSVVCERWEAT